MIRNYIKIAWRNLLKNKTFSIINLAGLSIGLVCFLLISLYIFDELTFNRQHKNADAIYRVIEFAYRTQIYWWVFVVAEGIALFISLLTVGFKAIKAAVTNPVKSLRTE